MRKSSFLILACIILLSCSPILRQDSVNRATFNYKSSEIKQNPAAYKGNLFVFGGIIASTTLVERGSLIEALYVPVNNKGYLKNVEDTGDRYLAIYPQKNGFLDPMIFRKGREITVAGQFIGLEAGKINEMDYIFPVFQIEEVHLWMETSKKNFYTSDSYHTPLISENERVYIYESSGHVQDEGNDLIQGDNEVRYEISSTQDSTKSVEIKPAGSSADQETPGKNRTLGDKAETVDQNQLLTKSERRDVDLKESPVAANDTLIEEPEVPNLSISVKQTAIKEAFKLPKEEKVPDGKKAIVEAKKSIDGVYYVQIGAWKSPDLAEKMFNKVREKYHETHMIVENNLHKVRILGVRTKEEGMDISQDIEKTFKMKPIVFRSPQ